LKNLLRIYKTGYKWIICRGLKHQRHQGTLTVGENWMYRGYQKVVLLTQSGRTLECFEATVNTRWMHLVSVPTTGD